LIEDDCKARFGALAMIFELNIARELMISSILPFNQTQLMMSKAFKNKRNASLRSNNFGQYLKYAIGEIILVVLGILLALAINNWNTNRKLLKERSNVFAIIKEDIVADTMEIGQVLKYYKSQEENFIAFRDGTATMAIYDTCVVCPFLTTALLPVTIEQRGFDLLQLNQSNLGHDSLVTQISQIYNYSLAAIELKKTLMTENVTENLNYWRKNYGWFAELMSGKSGQAFKEYTINDPEYKNQIAWIYVLIYGNFLPELEFFKDQMTKLLVGIDERLDE